MTKSDKNALARAKNLQMASSLAIKRLKTGLKASWVADQMGISPPTLCYLEIGRSKWTPELVDKFLKAIGQRP